MVDMYGQGLENLKHLLLGTFKDQRSQTIGPLSVVDFTTYHLLGSIYDAGIFRDMDTWTVYPGHTGGGNAALDPFVDLVAKLFQDRPVIDLLWRHTESKDSGKTRRGGGDVDFSNQLNTVCLRPEHGARVKDKSVLVLDDFAKHGFSQECARNLLLTAGAASVVSVNIGKYGPNYRVFSPTTGYDWDPYSPTNHGESAPFQDEPERGMTNRDAGTEMRSSYERVSDMVH